MNTNPLIEIRAASRTRLETGVESRVTDVSLTIAPASVTVITGPEGCGKNLVLGLLGLLEVPDSGEVFFQGEPTAAMTDDARATFRSHHCGYVFDVPFLLPTFSVIENVAMPVFKISQVGPEVARRRTEDLLAFTGLTEFASAMELSPALQQRAALARALVNEPVVLFVQNVDALLPVGDMPAFRRLLHDVTHRYGAAVVMSATTGFPPGDNERRIEIESGRVLSDVSA